MNKFQAWFQAHGPDLGGYFGIGLMALGVGMENSTAGAIAVFALGLPILEIKRHMREQLQLNLMVLHALRDISVTMQERRKSHTRIAEEGITRE